MAEAAAPDLLDLLRLAGALAAVVGLVVSVLQVATSIQDVTVTFIPKILAVFLATLFTLHWMMRLMIEFTQRVFAMIAGVNA